MKSKTRAIIAYILWTILCVTLTIICVNKTSPKCRTSTEYIDTKAYVDTVTIYQPEADMTAQVGTTTYQLPRNCIQSTPGKSATAQRGEEASPSPEAKGCEEQYGAGAGGEPRQCEDTIAVDLPIIQRHYADSLYEAWVSGPIDPQLDSISIINRREVTTIRQTIYKPPNRWHIGLTAGYGYSPRGFQPYIGIGITYSIISF